MTVTTIVLPIIFRILIICNNGYNESYSNCDNLTIMIITIKIIHQLMFFLLKIDFYGFFMYDILNLISCK